MTQQTIQGYWDWTWSNSTPPSDTNLNLAFSGWTNVDTALQQSQQVFNQLQGDKYISLGGGNANGAFNNQALKQITAAINAGAFSAYDGIAYDVEEGDSGLEEAFQQSFSAAKQQGLKVLVTVSHSAPYGIADANALMQSFFSNEDIDILSPQLYTTGEETENDYATSAGVEWSQYKQCKASIAPSIVNSGLYESAQSYFTSQDVEISGYIQWQQAR